MNTSGQLFEIDYTIKDTFWYKKLAEKKFEN